MRSHLPFLASVLPTAVLAQNGAFSLPFEKRTRSLSKRASGSGTLPVALANEETDYLVNIEVGTPPQKLQVQIDTGSSDLWVPDVSQCPSNTACPYGAFSAKQSSTFNDVGAGLFNISYMDGSGASGDYFTDVLQIAGATLSNFTMAVATQVVGQNGPVLPVLGVSYDLAASEATLNGQSYPNLPYALQSAGIINTVAYSLWLDDLTQSGSILFGGIDTSLFRGPLQVIDVQPYQGAYYAFFVTLDSVTVTTGSQSGTVTSIPGLAVLDSGTSLAVFPPDVFDTIISEFPNAQSDNQGNYVVPCTDNGASAYFTFNFGQQPGGPSINVNVSEFLIPIPGQSQYCQLGMAAGSDNTYTLGDTFLRSAYVVYDLVNNQIGMAPAGGRTSSSNVVTFPSMSAAIPTLTGSGVARATSNPGQSGSSSSSGSGSSPSSSSQPGTSQSAATRSPLPASIMAVCLVMTLCVVGL